DFRPCTCCTFGKQVAFRYGIPPFGQWLDPQYFPPEVVGVRCRGLIVGKLPPGAFIHWRVTIRFLGIGIVARRQVEVSMLVELQVPRRMAAVDTLRWDFKDDGLGGPQQ